ncbi:MAG: hypothetical protein NTZ61_17045 [Proteobacteria bacterium]|nr:hypothetical protein [Pseudomonadota bacterium]
MEAAKAQFGVRAVAGVLFLLGLSSLATRRDYLPGPPILQIAVRLGFLALLAIAMIADTSLPLHFIPSLVYLVLCGAFLASLRDGASAIGRAARLMHPYVPDFVDSYCRKVTVVWAFFFAANAVATAALALFEPSLWAAWTGGYAYAAMAVLSAVEFLVRKSWFRYYGNGPVDRLLAALLPPENTWQGRRSKEYVTRMRRELGIEP